MTQTGTCTPCFGSQYRLRLLTCHPCPRSSGFTRIITALSPSFPQVCENDNKWNPPLACKLMGATAETFLRCLSWTEGACRHFISQYGHLSTQQLFLPKSEASNYFKYISSLLSNLSQTSLSAQNLLMGHLVLWSHKSPFLSKLG